MAVFYNSLRFQLSYLTLLPPEKRRIVWVCKAATAKGLPSVNVFNDNEDNNGAFN